MKIYAIGLLAFLGVAYGATFTASNCRGSDKTTCKAHLDLCHWDDYGTVCSIKGPNDHPNPGTEGGNCNMMYTVNNGGKEKYTTPTGGQACNAGLVCTSEDEPVSGVAFDGICQTEICYGQSDPEVGTRDSDPTNEASIRVTICHRTCSATNPWVRITIDDDAWNRTACVSSGGGHERNHAVTPECDSKAPWTQWGVNRKDYLIRWHGTREWVRTHNGWPALVKTGNNYKRSQEEKDYWFFWERACPYVRKGMCCGDPDITGPCCGDAVYPDKTISIELEKKVIAKTSADSGFTPCQNGHLMDNGIDDLEMHSGVSGEQVVYVYEAKNTGSVALCNIMLSDPLISSGAFTDYAISGNSFKSFIGTTESPMTDGCLEPGESVCFHMPPTTYSVIAGYEKEPARVDATPIGVIPGGVGDVFDEDDAGVDLLPQPGPVEITLEKKVGPVGPLECPDQALMEMYTDSVNKAFNYYYIITNPSASTKVCNIKLSDALIRSGKFSDLEIGETFDKGGVMENGCLLPGGSVCIASPQTGAGAPTIPDGGETKPATVTGTNDVGTSTVEATDDAGVMPVSIKLEKKVVGQGTYPECPQAGLMETYVNTAGSEAWYTYTITNTGDKTLCDIVLSDGALVVGAFTGLTVLMPGGCLAPDASVCVVGPSASSIPNSKDDENDAATVTAFPQGETGAENQVSAEDTAGVLPASIEIQKKVNGGIIDNCPDIALMGDNDYELYTGPMGTDVTYFYYITNTGLTNLCHISLSDNLEVGGFGSAITGQEMKNGCLKPGVSMCYHSASKIPSGPEGTDAVVTGTPAVNQETVYSGSSPVTDADSATVQPADITLEKKVKKGVDTTCPDSANMAKGNESLEKAIGFVNDEVTYYYLITNTGSTKLCSILLSDPKLDGAGSFTDFAVMPNGCLDPAGSICVAGPPGAFIPSGGEDELATVSGVPSDETKNPLPGDKVTDSDDAAVVDMGPLTASILLEKKVELGSQTTCPLANQMQPGDQLELATGSVGAPVTYYYLVTNTGTSVLCNIVINDPISGTPIKDLPLMADGECLKALASLCVVSPVGATIPSLAENVEATATGTPSNDDGTAIAKLSNVSSSNPAGVAPEAVPTASISIEKKVEIGSHDTCPLDAIMNDAAALELATGPVGDEVTYYYKVTNTGEAVLCNIVINDPITTTPIVGLPLMASGCLEKGELSCIAVKGKTIPSTPETVSATATGTPTKDDKTTPITQLSDVSSSNPAAVEPVEPEPETDPLPNCPFPMDKVSTIDDVCTGIMGKEVVKLVEIVGSDATKDYIRSVESTILYDVAFSTDSPVSGYGIEFKVNNPFPGAADVFVEYQKPVGQENIYGDECFPMAFATGCPAPPGGDNSVLSQCVKPSAERLAHSIVDIYIVTKDERAAASAAAMGDCCEEAANLFVEGVTGGVATSSVVKLTYFFYCECPEMAPARGLRGGV